MARSLTIEIWGYNWEIGTEGIGKSSQSPFAQCEVNSDGITYLYNYDLMERDLKTANDEGGKYLERCSFTYIPMNEDGMHDPHSGKTFEGDFIDAFVFILKELEKETKRRKNG